MNPSPHPIFHHLIEHHQIVTAHLQAVVHQLAGLLHHTPAASR